MAEKSIYQAVGKKKNAIARVYLKPGKGELVVNGRSFEKYFGRESSRMIVKQPLELTKLTNQFHISINSSGGGLSGQAEAIRHGLSKAILQFNPELRKELKKAGYLTRDPRVVERKKYGRHKARKRPQCSKR